MIQIDILTIKGEKLKRIKQNVYSQVDDETVAGISTNTGIDFIFDLSDLDLVSKYVWHSDKDGYQVGKDCENGYKIIRLNRLLMNFPENKIVDHEDRNIHNYKRNNLRVLDDRNSSINKNPRKDKKTSEFIGVSYSESKKVWIARISITKGNEIYLGGFKTEKEALISRLIAEKAYYKEFAPQKHLFEEYEIQ